jgi:predicted alpha/beta-hydrolase family hydrolase
MSAAEDTTLAELLLLFSYPLHAPGRPEALRTSHFPMLNVPCVFIHGSKDPFGTIDEMRAAIALIPSAVRLIEADGSGHDLRRRGSFPTAEALKAVEATWK